MLSENTGVRPLTKSDWEDIRAIYLEGISTGNATFEREAPSWDKWHNSHLPYCRLVAEKSGKSRWLGRAECCVRPLCILGSCRDKYLRL